MDSFARARAVTLPIAFLLLVLATSCRGCPATRTLTGLWNGTGNWPNAPFTMDLTQTGNNVTGKYKESGGGPPDGAFVSGTYTGGNDVVLEANDGDQILKFEGTWDGPNKIKGTMKATNSSQTYTFEMTRS